MRIIQSVVILFFTVSVLLFACVFWKNNQNNDQQGPVISMAEDSIQISVKDDVSAILNGVSAKDSKDGDVSDTLVVEGLSNFTQKGRRQATIAAFDQDRHVTKVTRDVMYTDYHSPHFSLKAPFRMNINGHESLLEYLSASDVLDGDISSHITIRQKNTDQVYTDLEPGEYAYIISVVNSAGDVAELPVTVEFYSPAAEGQCPKVMLSDYLIYIRAGSKLHPSDYIEGVTANGRTWSMADLSEDAPYTQKDIQITNHVKTDTPGTYEIVYTMDNEEQDQSKIRLIVVVEK